ncbi:MAG: cell division protein FtsB [Sulfuricaulis sp.]
MNFAKVATYVLLGILLLLQYPLWLGSGGVLAIWRLNREIAAQQVENAQLKDRNEALEADVDDLKQGLDAVEERARMDLGMVKKGEVFYQVYEDPQVKPPPANTTAH